MLVYNMAFTIGSPGSWTLIFQNCELKPINTLLPDLQMKLWLKQDTALTRPPPTCCQYYYFPSVPAGLPPPRSLPRTQSSLLLYSIYSTHRWFHGFKFISGLSPERDLIYLVTPLKSSRHGHLNMSKMKLNCLQSDSPSFHRETHNWSGQNPFSYNWSCSSSMTTKLIELDHSEWLWHIAISSRGRTATSSRSSTAR